MVDRSDGTCFPRTLKFLLKAQPSDYLTLAKLFLPFQECILALESLKYQERRCRAFQKEGAWQCVSNGGLSHHAKKNK